MFTSPYQTTLIERRYQVDQLVLALQRANIEAPLEKMKTPLGNVIRDAYIVTPSSDYDHVPSFTQCVNIGKADSPKWVVDARPYMRNERHSGTYRLVAQNDYMFQCIRMALTLQVNQKDSDALLTLGKVPVVTFVRLITHALTNVYQLPLESQIQVSIICAYYYLLQCRSEKQITESENALLAQKITGMVSIPVNTVMEIMTELNPMGNVRDLVDAIRQHSKSLRLKDFTFENLFMMVANTWIGVNSRENIGVALEHIPTWIALVYTALDEHSYRKTILAQRAQTAGKQIDIKYFIERTYRLVTEQFE